MSWSRRENIIYKIMYKQILGLLIFVVNAAKKNAGGIQL